jgi:hypothetical protein
MYFYCDCYTRLPLHYSTYYARGFWSFNVLHCRHTAPVLIAPIAGDDWHWIQEIGKGKTLVRFCDVYDNTAVIRSLFARKESVKQCMCFVGRSLSSGHSLCAGKESVKRHKCFVSVERHKCSIVMDFGYLSLHSPFYCIKSRALFLDSEILLHP